MNKQSSKAMIERMEFVNCLNRELNRKVCAYDKVLTEVQKNRDWVWPSDTSEDNLRKLIMEHPDYPLLVIASDNANSGDCAYMPCGSISAKVGEFLDCMQDVDDKYCFTSRIEFEDSVYYSMYGNFDGSEQELEQEVERKVMEYDPYWKPCIIVQVDN